jgi:hypothetical protein
LTGPAGDSECRKYGLGGGGLNERRRHCRAPAHDTDGRHNAIAAKRQGYQVSVERPKPRQAKARRETGNSGRRPVWMARRPRPTDMWSRQGAKAPDQATVTLAAIRAIRWRART